MPSQISDAIADFVERNLMMPSNRVQHMGFY